MSQSRQSPPMVVYLSAVALILLVTQVFWIDSAYEPPAKLETVDCPSWPCVRPSLGEKSEPGDTTSSNYNDMQFSGIPRELSNEAIFEALLKSKAFASSNLRRLDDLSSETSDIGAPSPIAHASSVSGRKDTLGDPKRESSRSEEKENESPRHEGVRSAATDMSSTKIFRVSHVTPLNKEGAKGKDDVDDTESYDGEYAEISDSIADDAEENEENLFGPEHGKHEIIFGEEKSESIIVGNNIEHVRVRRKSLFDRPSVRVKFNKNDQSMIDEHMESVSKFSSRRWAKEVKTLMLTNIDQEIVIVAFANNGVREITMNFVASMYLNNYTQFMIFCYDLEIYRLLVTCGFEENAVMVPPHWITKKVSGKEARYGDRPFSNMNIAKMELILRLLNLGQRIFFVDVDLVFLSPHVIDYIRMEDRKRNVHFYYMVDNPEEQYVNGGLWIARPTPEVIRMWSQTLELCIANPDSPMRLDQVALNFYLDEEQNGTFKYSRYMEPLPKLLFPSGYYFSKHTFLQDLEVYPMILHVNYIVGASKKKKKLKEFNMWYIGEDFA